MASAGGEATQWLVGEVTNQTFDDWLGLLEQKAGQNVGQKVVGAKPIETREFRNGYFYRGMSHLKDSNGDRHQALSLYVSNRGVSYVFTLSVADGELTHAIINTLNLFLDSLYLP